MNEPKEKTYKVLWGMCFATYYEVKASSEEEAIERSGYNYDSSEEWAIDTWEDDLVAENCHYAEITCEEDGELQNDWLIYAQSSISTW